jgi:beta-lactamase regulating signal transducer with metallopeptidase domain
MVEVCDALIRANLVAGLAILAVLAARIPARRRFGPELAYSLWTAPPLAVAATLTPLKAAASGVGPSIAHLAPAALAPGLVAAWLLGGLAAAALMWRAQAAFLRSARSGRAGPAVVGVINPRLVMPPDDGRYSPAERDLVRAHEREHILRKDPRAGALIAAAQCVAWFNPLAHLAAHLARLDQELACDAAVLRRRPEARALYARTLLKTQLAGAALPLGCYWPARSRHPLEVRVELLRRRPDDRNLEGAMLVATGVVAAAILAWAVEPPLPPAPPRALPSIDEANSGSMSVMLVTWPSPVSTAKEG